MIRGSQGVRRPTGRAMLGCAVALAVLCALSAVGVLRDRGAADRSFAGPRARTGTADADGSDLKGRREIVVDDKHDLARDIAPLHRPVRLCRVLPVIHGRAHSRPGSGLPCGHSARTSRIEDVAASADGEPGACGHATLPLVKVHVDGSEARR